MSLKEPRFGEVFLWTQNDHTSTKIMYVAPADDDREFWVGVTIAVDGPAFGAVGEVNERVPLVGKDWLKWSEVPDVAD